MQCYGNYYRNRSATKHFLQLCLLQAMVAARSLSRRMGWHERLPRFAAVIQHKLLLVAAIMFVAMIVSSILLLNFDSQADSESVTSSRLITTGGSSFASVQQLSPSQSSSGAQISLRKTDGRSTSAAHHWSTRWRQILLSDQCDSKDHPHNDGDGSFSHVDMVPGDGLPSVVAVNEMVCFHIQGDSH